MLVSQTMAVALSARSGQCSATQGREEANGPVGEEADDAQVSGEAARDQPQRRRSSMSSQLTARGEESRTWAQGGSPQERTKEGYMKLKRAQESWAGLRPEGSAAPAGCQGARTLIYSTEVY